MNNLKQLERLRKVHKLIKLENTGTPGELAQKLRISTWQTYLVLEELKEMDAPIQFNRRTIGAALHFAGGAMANK